jgi:hypothetical protein
MPDSIEDALDNLLIIKMLGAVQRLLQLAMALVFGASLSSSLTPHAQAARRLELLKEVSYLKRSPKLSSNNSKKTALNPFPPRTAVGGNRAACARCRCLVIYTTAATFTEVYFLEMRAHGLNVRGSSGHSPARGRPRGGARRREAHERGVYFADLRRAGRGRGVLGSHAAATR